MEQLYFLESKLCSIQCDKPLSNQVNAIEDYFHDINNVPSIINNDHQSNNTIVVVDASFNIVVDTLTLSNLAHLLAFGT